jgi:signal transduction histidine kinase
MEKAADQTCITSRRLLRRGDGTTIPVRCIVVSVRSGPAVAGFAWMVQPILPRHGSHGDDDPGALALSRHTPPSSMTSGSGIDGAAAARLASLERAVAARDEFIGTIAHELRYPLTPLLFQVRLAIDKLEQAAGTTATISTERVHAQFQRIERRLHRLLETLDRLLDVSRLSSGRIDLVYDRLVLADDVSEALTSFEAELAMAHCELSTSLDTSVVGWWDRVRLHQICANLISNAIRFGAGRPIEVTVTGDDQRAVLTVRDHGIGIAASQQHAIFERFERGGADRRSGGFGIGLWVVRQLCTAMGGSITVQSRVGEGALFTVTLPRRARDPPIRVLRRWLQHAGVGRTRGTGLDDSRADPETPRRAARGRRVGLRA